MSVSQDGIIPVENVLGGGAAESVSVTLSLRELYDDCRADAIGEIQGLCGSSEVGEPRAYIEETIGDRQYRDVYKTYPYVVLSMNRPDHVHEVFDKIVADARAEVDRMVALGFQREALVLVWRMNERIVVGENHCRKCGGSVSVRTRFLVKPDRHMLEPGELGKDLSILPLEGEG